MQWGWSLLLKSRVGRSRPWVVSVLHPVLLGFVPSSCPQAWWVLASFSEAQAGSGVGLGMR